MRPTGRPAWGLAMTLALFSTEALADGEVNIYSYRQPETIQPVLDDFTRKTGIETNVLYVDTGLTGRMQAEGENSPADIILTVDIARLREAEDSGVTQPVNSRTIDANIPAQYRDPKGEWFGLTMRARAIYASKERVADKAITYEALAEPTWKGRICTRSGQYSYNVALVASMVAHHGADDTGTWLRGLKDNLAERPSGNDRTQARAIFSGTCDLAIGDPYYIALMTANDRDPEEQQWASAVKILFPNAADRGTHVNISGMALAKHAPNRENAVRLMEYLSQADSQTAYAGQVSEYPVNPAAKASGITASFGPLKPDTLPLAEVDANRVAASELIDKVGFNDDR